MKNAIKLSPVKQVLVEKSIKGYKEIEYDTNFEKLRHYFILTDEFNFIYENFVPVNYQNNFDFLLYFFSLKIFVII